MPGTDRKNQKVLVLGATGSIGQPVMDALSAHGHQPVGLARSDASARLLQDAGHDILRGDITRPEAWLEQVPGFDAVIHAANTWADNMADTDRKLTGMLIEALATPTADKTLIYTDGCWTYGDTGDEVATETSPHRPMAFFESSEAIADQVLNNGNIRGQVIYPAMVYERDGGVLEEMVASAKQKGAVDIVGRADTRWTMVHRNDLAQLYVLILEQAEAGSRYNGSGTDGIAVGELAKALSRRFNLEKPPVVIPVDDELRAHKPWLEGYATDQQMSSKKAKRELGWKPVHTDVIAEIS